ncbi:hypothetical protein DL766_005904 [Monosporascus sp. MC13-8B]|uniref:Uncharacterized protein n=1 Tax=Monosporascus cannonballus TaxID=155416 RepID=A0ABY0GR50_9PEZI|nr:hypothetical protein DL762_010615 [Monosporascus cannonballus]RYO88854.1 hypothetical protein DL763_005817 [Monosporascus cannonballus]RYP28406.1 hypothetical protein DL766_005904 [Monosporascus sp. MC13-8B]
MQTKVPANLSQDGPNFLINQHDLTLANKGASSPPSPHFHAILFSSILENSFALYQGKYGPLRIRHVRHKEAPPTPRPTTPPTLNAGNRQTGSSSSTNENQGRSHQEPAGVTANYAIYDAAAGRGGRGGPRPAPAPPGPAPATAPTFAPGTDRGRGVSHGSSGVPAVDASFVGPRIPPRRQQGERAAPAKAQEFAGTGVGGSGGEDKVDSDGGNRGGKYVYRPFLFSGILVT